MNKGDSSSTLPPALACWLQSSIMGGHSGEEGLGFWALKSERERVNNRGGAYHHIGGLVPGGARNIGRGLSRRTSPVGLLGLGWQQPEGKRGLDRTKHHHLKAKPNHRHLQKRFRFDNHGLFRIVIIIVIIGHHHHNHQHHQNSLNQ